MAKKCLAIVVAVGFILSIGICSVEAVKKTEDGGEVVVKAIRTEEAPVIDGKIDDSCWQKAVPITNFLSMNSHNPATYQTIGYVLFDDKHLYIGIKCLEPDIANIKTKARGHENEMWSKDDVVEIMIDPGLSKTDYFQFAINPSGSKFDCSRSKGGDVGDDSWNGEWEADSFIGDSYWSCEVVIPFYTLGVTSDKAYSAWGISICREKQTPREYSSIGKLGSFNVAEDFRELRGMDVNFKQYSFRKYSYRIGVPEVLGEIKDNKLYARLMVPIKNEAGIEKKAKIERLIIGKAGRDLIKSEDIVFKAGEEKNIPIELLELVPMNKTGTYSISEPEIKKIKILDADEKRIFAISSPAFYTAMEIKPVNPKELEMEVVINFSGEKLKKNILLVGIKEAGKTERLLEREITSPAPITRIKFSDSKILTGEFIAQALLKGTKGEIIAEADAAFTGTGEGIKRLNNLVTELLNVKMDAEKTGHEYKFENPRDGWIFISTTADIKKNDKVYVSIDSTSKEGAIIVHDKVGKETFEAMRLLSAGEHILKVWSAGKSSVSLTVRAIPELIYNKFQYNPHITSYGPYDWEFLKKHDILRNVNCIIGYVYPPLLEEWKKQGKKWIFNCGVPGADDSATVTADEAYAYWSSDPGFQEPLLDGVIADEFHVGLPGEKFEIWTEAIKRIYDNEKFRGKTFYPYCNNLYNNESERRFIDAIVKSDYKIAWEVYLPEQSTEDEADKLLKSMLSNRMVIWEKVQPGITKHTIMCLAYMSLITAETINNNPAVDYKVFMDMQFNHLANDSAFAGLYGIMEYLSSYADEETVRWAGKLYRHYGIEGRTGMLSKEYGFKYVLDHIQNPDFDNGTVGWGVNAAEEASVGTKKIKGYSWLQGRYLQARPRGDAFLWMKRSKNGPNVISQEIKNLEPGKLYSLKMVTGDYGDLLKGKSEMEKHGVSIVIDNVELIKDKCFQEVKANSSGHDWGTFDGKNKFWFNYHSRVFKAKGSNAKLLISDWINDKEPGGPIGQELMFNFIEVQPYLE
ncbi:MAG: sugar-binding protein [bacterium]|nr:sugar-binding protein [bacterium]